MFLPMSIKRQFFQNVSYKTIKLYFLFYLNRLFSLMLNDLKVKINFLFIYCPFLSLLIPILCLNLNIIIKKICKSNIIKFFLTNSGPKLLNQQNALNDLFLFHLVVKLGNIAYFLFRSPLWISLTISANLDLSFLKFSFDKLLL